MLYKGQIIPELKTGSTMIQLNYRDPYWELTIGFPDMTKEELSEIENGDFFAAFVNVDDALFLVFAVGRIPLADTPFEPRLTSPFPSFHDYKDGEGAPFVIVAADTFTGEVKHLRIIGLGTAISNDMTKKCNALKEKPFNQKEYAKKLNKIYAKYEQSKRLLQFADKEKVFLLATQKENP